MIENFKNWLIVKLIKSTHIHAGCIYAMLWKLPNEENQFYVDQIKKAREESGCFLEDDYDEWFKDKYNL